MTTGAPDGPGGPRAAMLTRLADAIGSVAVPHPTRVAVDGPPAAGKTTLADELAVLLHRSGRPVIRATIDDFLVPRARRYRRGEFSAEGCYLDAHDHPTLARVLLTPLGPTGDRRIRTTPTAPPQTAPPDAVLLFDGVFLLRPELVTHWDLRLFVDVDLARTVTRAVTREQAAAAPAATERRWRERYIPAQELYFARVGPTTRADIIIHNDDPATPRWTFRTP